MRSKSTGFDRKPYRYAAHGRETIDRIRDSMTDREFAMFCQGQVIKYSDRQGRTVPGEPVEWSDEASDEEKTRWYRMMRDHVLIGGDNYPDPRSLQRPDFTPYKRQTFNEERL